MFLLFRHLLRPLLGAAIVGASVTAWAYPNFIGFGYTNCMTCHYNPLGGGQLNDYGRALFATEIAAKPFWKPNASDEDLANTSGFLFDEPGQGNFKPSIKYRELLITLNPGNNNDYQKYLMQLDAGFAYHFDKNDKYIFVGSLGYTPQPLNSDVHPGAWNYNLLSHEHYLRVQVGDGQFFSFGLIDIAYGIRFVDHTAVNRQGIGLDEYDQVHGILYNYFKDKWMISLHALLGNQFRNVEDRLYGGSGIVEYEFKEKATIGVSVLDGSTQAYRRELLGVHARVGVGKGSSVLTEWGLNKLANTGGPTTTGAYGIVSGTIRLVRGLDLEEVVQMLKGSLQDSSPEQYSNAIGFIYYPFQRLEFRLQAVDGRQLSPTTVQGDSWALLSQMHVAL